MRSSFVPTWNKMEVHRLKFLPLSPKSLTCCSFNSCPDLPTLALSRSDASIEIWKYTGTKKDFIYQCTIPGKEGSSVECVKWSGKRLFSAGLSGDINEWSPVTSISPVASVNSASSIWSMDINSEGSVLAAGCENGQVTLFDISYNVLVHSRTLDTQDGRILSLSWHPSSPLIAVGTSNSSIKVLNTQSSHSTEVCISLSDKDPVLVWSVLYLSNDTIVSGSSLGRVDFWHSNFGTLKQSFSLHSADVLTLASNDSENVIFASGVDHKIVRFKKVEEVGGGVNWVTASDIRPHTHDVRSLSVSCNGILASGGIDGELCVNKMNTFDKGHTVRYSPFTGWAGRFHIASSANILLFQDDNALKLWRLTPKEEGSEVCSPDKDALLKNDESEGNSVSLTNELPVFLLEIQSKHRIISSAISSDATLIVFSCHDLLYVYSMKGGRVKCTATLPLTVRSIDIERNQIAICDSEGVVKISSADKIEFNEVDISSKKSQPFIQVRYSPCGSYLMIMNCKYRMYIIDSKDHTILYSLPRLDSHCPPLIAFNELNEIIIFTSSERELYCFNLLNGEGLRYNGFVKQRRRNHRLMLGISRGLYTVKSSVCVVYDGDSLCFVRYGDQEEEKESQLGCKRPLEGSKELKYDIKYYSNIVYAGLLDCGQLVMVENQWSDRMTVLPPTLQIDRYGN